MPENVQSAELVNVVVIGNSAVGKSIFLLRWATGVIRPFEWYVPTIFENYSVSSVIVDDKPVRAQLWDTRMYIYSYI